MQTPASNGQRPGAATGSVTNGNYAFSIKRKVSRVVFVHRAYCKHLLQNPLRLKNPWRQVQTFATQAAFESAHGVPPGVHGCPTSGPDTTGNNTPTITSEWMQNKLTDDILASIFCFVYYSVVVQPNWKWNLVDGEAETKSRSLRAVRSLLNTAGFSRWKAWGPAKVKPN